MNGTMEYPVEVCICLSDGSIYRQPLPLDTDDVDLFLGWFRNPKAGDIWTWQIPSDQCLHLFHRRHIVSVDIYGYVEPEHIKSRWYQRMKDKYDAWKMLRKRNEFRWNWR